MIGQNVGGPLGPLGSSGSDCHCLAQLSSEFWTEGRAQPGAALLRRPSNELLRAAWQELLDPSKPWRGGRGRGPLTGGAGLRADPSAVSLGVVPLVEVALRGSRSYASKSPLARSARSLRTASARQAPADVGQLHPVADQVPARAFDDACGDGIAGGEVAVVVQIRRVLLQVVGARIDRLTGVLRQAGAVPAVPDRRTAA